MVKYIINLIGLDKTIAYTSSARIIQVIGAVLNLFLISIFLSKEEQGFYYTFGSILAIQVFFELGLNSVLVQFVSHEVAHLKFDPLSLKFSGSEYHLSRLSSLLLLVIKIFSKLSIALFLILNILGYLFFKYYSEVSLNINWHLPWVLICTSTALMLSIDAIIGYLQGLGFVEKISKIIFFQQLTLIPISALILYNGGGLWALGITNLCSVLILFISLFLTDLFKILRNIKYNLVQVYVSYKNEIFPFQWKIALSWISGYFIFQLMNPVLFAIEGPVIAGKMGMTLTALNGISSLSMSWITTKIPKMSGLVATEQYDKLDLIFNKTVNKLLIVNFILLSVFIAFVHILEIPTFLKFDRFLPFKYILALSVVTFSNQLIFSWATYLRCHKKEPFLINSLVGGILCGFSTFYFGNKYGIDGVVYGYTALTILIGLPWAFITYSLNKSKWH